MSHSRIILLSIALTLTSVNTHAALPVVTAQADVYRVFRGESIRLQIQVNTDTVLTKVEWRHDGNIISNPLNTSINNSYKASITMLVVPDATTGNSGTYVAYLTNQSGTTLSRPIAVMVSDSESPLDPWQALLPTTVPNRISVLRYFDGRFVAGTNQGTIHVSTDGENWIQANVSPNPFRTRVSVPPIRSIVFHKDRYFAFTDTNDFSDYGYGGWTSEDLLHWDFLPSLPRVDGQVVSNGVRMLTARYTPPNFAGEQVSSLDGVTWVPQPQDSPVRYSTDVIVAYKGAFFALFSGDSAPWFRSEDGVTWTNVSANAPDIFKYAYGFGKFVEFQGNLLYFMNSRMWKSADGLAWSEVKMNGINPLGSGTGSPSAAFTGLGKIWISDYNGNCRNSGDLVNWQYLASKFSSATPQVAVAGSDSTIACSFSSAGIALTRDPSNNFSLFPADDITSIYALTSTPAGILAQTSPYIRFSENGEDWAVTNLSRPPVAHAETIAYGNGFFLRESILGRYKSWDGRMWKYASTQGNSSLNRLIYGNGRFLIFSYSSTSPTVSWSEDGDSWSEKTNVPAGTNDLVHVDGKFWALASGSSTGGNGSKEYRFATSVDGVTWQSQTIPLSPDANVAGVFNLVAFRGRLILASADSSWWLVSADAGLTWERLNTGFGFLYNEKTGSSLGNSATSLVVHEGRLLAGFWLGDIISSADGVTFSRCDGPGGKMTTHAGALFTATQTAILRSGHTELPTSESFGLAEGATPARGQINEIGIVITDYQAGDRIEFRINGELVYETDNFYAYYGWDVDAFAEQTLVATVIRADGTRTSRSWSTDPAYEVETKALPPALTTNGRLGYQRISGGLFYHLTPDGVLRRSSNLLQWSSETIPGVVNLSSFDINSLRIITRTDGARLLSLRSGIWVSPPGGNTWTPVDNFPRVLNGQTHFPYPSGNLFTVLYQTNRVVPMPAGLSTATNAYVYDYERYTSQDGITWTSHGLLPTVGRHLDGVSDGTTTLWIEDKGLDEQARVLTPVRLRRLSAVGTSETIEPLPGFTPQWVARMGGKWIVQGNVASVTKLLISDNSSSWAEGTTARPNIAMQGIVAHGDGIWIGRDSSGYFTTTDFLTWSPLPTPPSSPVWAGDRWANSEPAGSNPIDHYESDDLINWRLVSSEWPTKDSSILTVTGDRLISTLGKGLFTMDATSKWSTLSSRQNVSACHFLNGAWLLAASDGGVGRVQEGIGEDWSYPLNAPPPTPSSVPEKVLGFLDNGTELLAYSNRALYVTTNGQSWIRRDTPTGRSVFGLVKFGGRLLLENGTAVNKRIDSSTDGGLSWAPASLPTGSYNYSKGSGFGPFGLYVEHNSAYYIANSSQRFRTDDGTSWFLLPSNTDAYLPRPFEVEQGFVEWSYAPSQLGYYQWRFRSHSGLWNAALTAPDRSSIPVGGYYRGRLVSLPAGGPRVTPLANLQLNFPNQPGHTAQAGDVIKVTVEVRNTGFDQAWLDTPLMVDISLDSGQIIGSTAMTGSIHTGESVIREVSLVLPRPLASGRYHLIARLRQDGGLPVDGIPEDDQTISSEPLLRVSGSSLRVGSLAGGQVWLNSPSEGIVVLDSGDIIEREAQAMLQAIPDEGQRFVGWSDEALGLAPEISVETAAADELVAYFAPGASEYHDWTLNPGLPGADTDRDGAPNVIEFLLGSDPHNGGKCGWSMIATPDEGHSIEFIEQLGITSHSLRVSISDNLVTWKEVGREQWTPVMRTPAAATWRVRLGSGKSSFARLEAVGP